MDNVINNDGMTYDHENKIRHRRIELNVYLLRKTKDSNPPMDLLHITLLQKDILIIMSLSATSQ